MLHRQHGYQKIFPLLIYSYGCLEKVCKSHFLVASQVLLVIDVTWRQLNKRN